MGKGLRGGIVVGVAVLAAAVVYSAMYFQRGLIRFDAGGMSIILILAWAAVVAVLLVVLWQRMLVREEYLRKFYLSDDTLFNFEIGAVPLSQASPSRTPDELVKYLHEHISRLTYEGTPANPPEGFEPSWCVSTTRFSAGKGSEEWAGVLQRIDRDSSGHRSFSEKARFANAAELEAVLGSIL